MELVYQVNQTGPKPAVQLLPHLRLEPGKTFGKLDAEFLAQSRDIPKVLFLEFVAAVRFHHPFRRDAPRNRMPPYSQISTWCPKGKWIRRASSSARTRRPVNHLV